jgi:hypothetical protein
MLNVTLCPISRPISGGLFMDERVRQNSYVWCTAIHMLQQSNACETDFAAWCHAAWHGIGGRHAKSEFLPGSPVHVLHSVHTNLHQRPHADAIPGLHCGGCCKPLHTCTVTVQKAEFMPPEIKLSCCSNIWNNCRFLVTVSRFSLSAILGNHRFPCTGYVSLFRSQHVSIN